MSATLITGANRGLGLALATACAERGDTVFAGTRHADQTATLNQLAGQHPGRFHILPLDVNDPAQRQAALGFVREHVERLDLVIHNAGVNSKSRGMRDMEEHVEFGRLTEEALLETLRTNAVSPLLFTQELEELLVGAEHPRIVAISSWFASLTESAERDYNFSYAGSKALMNMYFRLAANALRPKGVIAFLVNPGWMQTDMGGARADLTPQEAASAILDLAERSGDSHAGGFYDWNGEPHAW